jgi:membrane-associated protein
MELLITFIDYFIHLDRYLGILIQNFGGWIYVILFMIIFCETGLVVTPFLPGDSLLFGLGAFAANPNLKGPLEVELIWILLVSASISGDIVNYSVGKFLGPKVFSYEDSRFFRKDYLDKTHAFYEKYGGKAIIIGKFMPIVRTFVPFVAGIGRMTYPKFIAFNVTGGLCWISIFLFGGYYFGNFPVVKQNFTLVIIAIVIISVMPGLYEYFRHRLSKGPK